MARGRKQVAHLDAPIDGPWELPEDWRWERLGNIADLIRGVSYKKGQAVAQPCSGHLSLLRGNNIQNGELLFEDLVHVDTSCVSELQRLEEGDIVLTMSSGSAALVGKSAIVRAVKEPITFGAFCACIRAHAKEDASWVYAFLQTDFYRTLISASAKGTNINNLKREDLLMLPLPVPPLEIQQRTVAQIDELFTELDDGEAALERAQDDFETYRKSLLKAAVTGELTADWRAANPPQETGEQRLHRILADRKKRWDTNPDTQGKKYKEPVSLSADERPTLPDGWTWSSLDQLVSERKRSFQSGPFGSNLKHSEFQPTGKLVIGIDNVQDGWFSMGSQHRISPEKFSELQKYRARPGDVLITVMATIGRSCVIPSDIEEAIITKHVYRMTMDLNAAVPDFVEICFRGHPLTLADIHGNTRGQTRPGLNKSILQQVSIPLPPLTEQAVIIERLAEDMEALALKGQLLSDLENVGQLRQAVLAAAFKGELVQ